MNFKHNFIKPIQDGFVYNLLDFSGTTSRGIYLYINLVLSILYLIAINILSGMYFEVFSWALLLSYMPITIRRMRDTGRSLLNFGWFILPFIGWFYGLYLLFIKKNPNHSSEEIKADNPLYHGSTLAIIIFTIITLYNPSLLGLKINNNPTVFAFEYAHTHPQVSIVIDYVSGIKSQPFIDFVWAQIQFFSPPDSPSHNPQAAFKILTDQYASPASASTGNIYDLFIMTASTHYPQSPLIKNPIYNQKLATKYFNIIEDTQNKAPSSSDFTNLLSIIYSNESHQHIHDLFKN